MKRPSPIQLVNGIGILTVILGLGLMVKTFKTHADVKQRLIAKREFQSRLMVVGQEWLHAQAIKAFYESLNPGAMPSIQSLVDASFTNRPLIPVTLTSTTPLPGWIEWHASLNIDGIVFPDIEPLFQRLAAQNPPWTVTRCDISAASKPTGMVRITLGVASLRRASWPAPDGRQNKTDAP
jgi:hypothetical protein